MKCLAGERDGKIRLLASKGDKDAINEMIRRGLWFDRKLLAEAKKVNKNPFQHHGKW
jgi:hypothetical protein